MSGVRVRFAPSPTGPLHIGGARSALFNWLFARQKGGTFIVRIEDTDLERSSRESEQNILEALRWLGLDWDEGVEVGGPCGPYRQTERLSIYQQYARQLLESGWAYPCYCTEEELAAEREALLARGEMPRYSGRCRHLTEQDRRRLEEMGRRPVLRFAVPAGENITVHDLVRGEVTFDTAGIGDFIIVKSDGIPTYNFAVVVDDHHMGITHVIRAEEHLSNTPRQILLYRAFGWPEPQFAHISLILGQDRSKMSKRHGATSIEQYREMGYLPEALVNFLALLGWSPGGEEEIFTLEELVQQFSLERVAKNPAIFDLDKLNWLNGHYIRQSSLDRLTELAIPFLQKAGYISGGVTPEQYRWLKQLVATVRDYLTSLSEITRHVDIFFAPEVEPEDEEARAVLAGEEVPRVLSALAEKVRTVSELDEDTARGILKKLPKELGLGARKVYLPIRVALTGRTHGPELYQVISLLGREKVLSRLGRVAGAC
ncbi:nondiscriminating glutamyl-tRNA synthetase [Desulfofundulus australicus DSM 11792]|uniref:Glutamate--tRNA ligase n=1 Tax=Desulfofundulus australicus DSM 11792 TaxID=1121425 RepID=A0A1M4ZUL3_9FIRM|nr:glutamate--tRNA ligase [Desulfofundulus australicus]MDK2888180.1 nondiscriminating glutamyl-tRNA synthetase [Thermoanaerobacter sp.]SHF21507.1 nondiscriminating glutamyl-tRNA synthetase [Desulfofundulus australicus DSM 11792]